jgi:intracellular multiplication protein IcmE
MDERQEPILDPSAQAGGAAASQEEGKTGQEAATAPDMPGYPGQNRSGLATMLRNTWNGPRRPLLILGGIGAVVLLFGLAEALTGSSHHAPAPSDQAPTVPQHSGMPGGAETAPYARTAQQYDAQLAKQATQKGASFVPPMSPLQPIHTNAPATIPPKAPAYVAPPPSGPAYAPYPYETALSREINGLVKGMVPVAAQTANVNTPIGGQFPKNGASAVAATASGQSASKPQPVVLAQPGHISFAVLDTSIKSTEPGPVMATIEDGRFAGARLLGGYVRHAGRVVVEFNEMTWHHQSYPIQAVAITTATARTALSTYTNYHTLYRYGWLIGASMLEGVTNALQYANTNTYLTGSGVGVVTQQLSNGQIAASAIGNVGTVLTPIMEQRFNTPPTVHVAAGTGVGILFMKPVEVPTHA